MQFICVTKSKAIKEAKEELLATASSASTEAAAFVEPAVDELEELHEPAAFGFSKRKEEKNHWKTFVCGPKPQLSRPCIGQDCPANSTTTAECADHSTHCKLPVLHRYCILSTFKESCCQSCADYLA